MSYLALIRCRRCNSAHFVSSLSEHFRHWFCHRTEDGMWCQTFNVWKGYERARAAPARSVEQLVAEETT